MRILRHRRRIVVVRLIRGGRWELRASDGRARSRCRSGLRDRWRRRRRLRRLRSRCCCCCVGGGWWWYDGGRGAYGRWNRGGSLAAASSRSNDRCNWWRAAKKDGARRSAGSAAAVVVRSPTEPAATGPSGDVWMGLELQNTALAHVLLGGPHQMAVARPMGRVSMRASRKRRRSARVVIRAANWAPCASGA